MKDLKRLEGTGVALATPFNQDLSIDWAGLKKLVDHVIDGGVNYLVVMGTTGESPTISKPDKLKILETVAEQVNGRLPIVYGLGGNDTQSLVKRASNLETQFVDAVLSANPYYNKPEQKGIIYHYEQLADHCKVPVILYNVPGRTASNLLSETTLALAEHDNIIGTKEASGDLVQCAKIAASKPKDFLLLSGDDMLTVPMISLGAKGVISVMANFIPKQFSDMVNAALKSDFVAANEIYYKTLPLNDLLMEEGNPVGLKYALSSKDICEAYVRPPLMVAGDPLKRKIDQWTY